jgi:hypothetical protein
MHTRVLVMHNLTQDIIISALHLSRLHSLPQSVLLSRVILISISRTRGLTQRNHFGFHPSSNDQPSNDQPSND